MRTLTFKQVSDERFGGNAHQLFAITEQLIAIFKKYPSVDLHLEGPMGEFRFPDSDHTFLSFRQNFSIQKHSRELSWNEIMGLINNVKSAHYKFVNKSDMRIAR
jgi:hypothetical protein|tara:strand:+ start:2593 stop:2904 length:312 start_codon:yes stop_codon:yes gene_type:complete